MNRQLFCEIFGGEYNTDHHNIFSDGMTYQNKSIEEGWGLFMVTVVTVVVMQNKQQRIIEHESDFTNKYPGF
jgi:hypothetical protein